MDVPPRCLLSDPAHPHTLPKECFNCGSDKDGVEYFNTYYYCDVCELVFHENRQCSTDLPGIKHPYHLNHFLSVTFRFSETETQSLSNPTERNQSAEKIKLLYDKVGNLDQVVESGDGCDWCGEKLGTLQCLWFVRPEKGAGLFCLPCNYFVHKSCIDLPRVIKLTRHPHRLSHTPCLPPPAKRSCGVCRRNVDVKHGIYSCNKGCSYAVHSKCATHEDIWDGIDLEGVPEEPEENIAPFVEVGHNLIQHFSHNWHTLRLIEDGHHHDPNKDCEACCRPVDSGGFYGCTVVHCDFYLHAKCANFPKKKEHPVHRHPLILQPARYGEGYTCLACGRDYTGFNDSCKGRDSFSMDVVCASVCEPFEHEVHPHPLFLFSGRDSSSQCGICGKEGKSIYILKCYDCQFTMCFKCATIPVVIRYKHDEHLLTLSGGEDSTDPYWCERCETRIDPKKWFYTCDQCCTTLHIGCLFNDSSYYKIGWSAKHQNIEVTFASNNGSTRPVCIDVVSVASIPDFSKLMIYISALPIVCLRETLRLRILGVI